MRLPGAPLAVVDEAKVRDYLLSPTHPVGRHKARVFEAAGYRQATWELLHADLVALAQFIEVSETSIDQHGQRFVGTGILNGPTGEPLPIVTVWLISSADRAPRLITAYPRGVR